MIRALYTAATAMQAQQTKTDIVSNNIANLSTAGYKKGRVSFKDTLYDVMEIRRDGETANLQVGNGVYVGLNQTIFKQGPLQNTDMMLDFSIEGPGFFSVMGSRGEISYTRKGDFQIALAGNGLYHLQTSDGNPVLDSLGNLIQFQERPGEDSLNVERDGTICIKDGEGSFIPYAQLGIKGFVSPNGLERTRDGFYAETIESGPPMVQGVGDVLQGYLEGSNVELYEEMTDLILAQRAYQFNSRVLQTADDMEKLAINLRG